MRTIWLAVLLGVLGLVACADSIYGTSGNTYDDILVACGSKTCGVSHGVTCGTCTGQNYCDGTQCVDVTQGMVTVPGGTLTLGASDISDNKPHSSTVATFQMDVTEVTVAAYKWCVDATKCSTSGDTRNCNGGISGRENCPINCVNWQQATNFCSWAGKRLPTEEEWEYAARYDDSRDYPWGNTAPSTKLVDFYTYGSRAVGSFPAGASKLGILDLAGSVWEWTSTWYCDTPPCTGTTGSGPVYRGGSCYNDNSCLRASRRFGDTPEGGSSLGIRCARTP